MGNILITKLKPIALHVHKILKLNRSIIIGFFPIEYLI
jgi:hypothetical protein